VRKISKLLINFSLEEDFKMEHWFSERKLSGWVWNDDFIRSEGVFLQYSAKRVIEILAVDWLSRLLFYIF